MYNRHCIQFLCHLEHFADGTDIWNSKSLHEYGRKSARSNDAVPQIFQMYTEYDQQ